METARNPRHIILNSTYVQSDPSINSPVSRPLSFVPYTMHGFTQGIILLNVLCDCQTDVIYLQELRLTADAIFDKLHYLISDYYLVVSTSLEDKTSSSILRGRRFGGLCMLIRRSSFHNFNNISWLLKNDN